MGPLIDVFQNHMISIRSTKRGTRETVSGAVGYAHNGGSITGHVWSNEEIMALMGPQLVPAIASREGASQEYQRPARRVRVKG